MAPNSDNTSTAFREDLQSSNFKKTDSPRETQKIVWVMVVYFTYLPLASVYGLYLGITAATWNTIIYTIIMYNMSMVGITAGAHRLWTHKAYKAKLPLQILLMLFHSTSNTLTTIKWVRDHLLHHKYSDTEADPHNARRGFFYSHVGYILHTKTAECREKGKTIDVSELYANPVLRFQQENCVWLIASVAFIIPTLIPLLWNETFRIAYHMNILRVLLAANGGMLVNSFTHLYGTRPYDRSILPTQNKIISFISLGEGFHNYHHAFPNDYRTAELGDNYLNLSTLFIDFCAWIGQAYDRNSVSDEIIRARMKRTGEKIQ